MIKTLILEVEADKGIQPQMLLHLGYFLTLGILQLVEFLSQVQVKIAFRKTKR
jgi:hypothetical protein